MEQGEARSLPSGETETNSYILGETDPAPLGSGEVESIPQPSGETEPALKASGETEISPVPLGEAEPHQRCQASWGLSLGLRTRSSPSKRRRAKRRLILSPRARPSPPQRRRARWNQAPVIPVRGEATLLCIQKFLTFGGYWFHLLGYPGIRSPTIIIIAASIRSNLTVYDNRLDSKWFV